MTEEKREKRNRLTERTKVKTEKRRADRNC
jgi:hypothetical protein